MQILGIETSCDETGVAIYDENKGLLSNQLYSQVKLHANYGGVVPELASRDHTKKLIPLVKLALKEANLKINNIDGIAYTAGPGLSSTLIVGATFSRSLAYSRKIPAVAVNHLEGHLLTVMLEKNKPSFPFIALLISGAHSQLILAQDIGKYQLLGDSLDDAVGETFDKVAKLLGINYPGGAMLSLLANKGVKGRYIFPKPMVNKPGLNFSFSGLKTFTINFIKKSSNDEQTRADIAKAFEDAIAETLTIKCRRALKQTGLKRLVIAGGVSSNSNLRFCLKKMVNLLNGELFFSRPEFCTDNGAMIAYVGFLKLKLGINTDLSVLIYPRWLLDKI